MATARLFNLARMTTATTGTGTVTLGSAVTGFLTFTQAGVTDGATVTYAIKDGNNSEIGRGVYTSSGTTLTRATILNSTNSNNALNLSGSAEVFITPSASDFLSAVNTQTGTTYTVLATDLGKLVTHSNGSSIAVTLPQATGLFGDGWYYFTSNLGAGVATITPTTSTINGAATLVLQSGSSALIVSNGTNYSAFVTIGPAALGVTVQAYDVDTLKSDTYRNLTAGYSATSYNAGTKSSGTFTPDEANGNLQYAINGGAHTLAPPTNNCTIVIQYTNNGGAGTITTSGFSKVNGDALTTVNGDDFMLYITKNNAFSVLSVVALQ